MRKYLESLLKKDDELLKFFALILSVIFLFLLFFNFKFLPYPQGDVHLEYDPTLRAGTGRYLTNLVILKLGSIFKRLFNFEKIYTYYTLQFTLSILLVIVSSFVMKFFFNSKVALLYIIAMLTSNYYLTLTYGFEYHRFYGLFFFFLSLLLFIKTGNYFLLSIFLVFSILFSTALVPVIGFFILLYILFLVFRKDYNNLKKILIIFIVFIISGIFLFVIFYLILKREELHNWLYYLVENMGQGKKYTNISMLPKIFSYFYIFEGTPKTITFFIFLIIGFLSIIKIYFFNKGKFSSLILVLFLFVPILVPLTMIIMNFTIIARLFFVIFPLIIGVMSYGIYYLFYETKIRSFKHKNLIFFSILLLLIILSLVNQFKTFHAFHVSDKVNVFVKAKGKARILIPTESMEFLPRIDASIETIDLSKISNLDNYESDDLIFFQPFHLFKRDDRINDAENKYKFYIALDSLIEFYDVSSLPFYFLHAEGFINFLINGIFNIKVPLRLKIVTVEEVRSKYSYIKDIRFFGEEDLSPYKL